MRALSYVSQFVILAVLALSAALAQETEEFVPSRLLEGVMKGDVQEIDTALSAGENIDLVNENGWSAALIATASGNLDILGALIDRGIDLNQANNDGVTPLMLAASLVRPPPHFLSLLISLLIRLCVLVALPIWRLECRPTRRPWSC